MNINTPYIKKKDDVLFTYKNVLHYLSMLYRNNCHYQKTVNYFHIKSKKKKKNIEIILCTEDNIE